MSGALTPGLHPIVSEDDMTPLQPILPLCVCGDPLCTIPYGHCHCKCGEKTRIATHDDRTYGYKKGLPRKFYPRHHRRIIPIAQEAVPFKIDGVYCRLVPLTRGFYAIVNESDYLWLMRWKWSVQYVKSTKGFVATRTGRVGKRCTVLMHRQIAAEDGLPEVDHKNRVSIDNRRNNLRPCTSSQNHANRPVHQSNQCGIKGVTPVGKRYRSTITKNRKTVHLGYFDTPKEAGDAYWEAAQSIHGEFACR